MSPWLWIVLIVAAAAALTAAVLGLLRLRQKHNRSAVAELPHEPGAGPQRVAVILNPVKAQADQARHSIRSALAAAGWPEPLILETTEDQPGDQQARQALQWGADVVLVGGGDGTVRMVAQELRGTEVALGLLPLGTGNLLARNLHLEVSNLEQSIQTALFGQQRRIDTGTFETENTVSGSRATHTFLVIAGLGMDAEVLGDTNDQLKKSVGWLAYSEAGVRHLPGRRRKVSLALDDEPPRHRKVRSVLFCNCALLPGGIDFVPGALIDDGVLDVVVISPRSAVGWLAVTGKVLFQHRRGLPVIDFQQSQRAVVRSATPQQVQVDGDPAGQATKVTVRVEPLSLLVRVNG
ncbi:diacylglycerol/lipid kinase family protein [Psychromicrobium xiongbiense]|uniref:diacylglycerol/lipid kinase family protein n=1 Tax=Psychromicrobium xiongbiense TaxID=3051184 RepID=UPI002553E12C|nr:diacylglycerol kinase family protein [Psychromicrobium sp. YIM S02556]